MKRGQRSTNRLDKVEKGSWCGSTDDECHGLQITVNVWVEVQPPGDVALTERQHEIKARKAPGKKRAGHVSGLARSMSDI